MAGQLEDGLVSTLEAHVEHCEECFLRMVAAAGEIPIPERNSLNVASTAGSRLDRYLASLSQQDVDPSRWPTSGESVRKRIGPYLVTGVLGAGGMSVVYRAKDPATGREVAVKTVRMPFVASFLAMLRQEIEFLRKAHHPAIVAVLDSDLMADEPWYAMELFEGPTLQAFNRSLWKERPMGHSADGPSLAPLPAAAGGRLGEVLRLFARLCDPIGFIHKEGMVHGDIKPSNVFLRDGLHPVLMDFGLASQARGTIGRETLDVTGRIRGTLPYIAPEIIRGQIPDARVDMYALGCMLYETIVGTPPFMSSSGVKIIDQHLTATPNPPSQRVSGVPPELDGLVLRLLAKKPSERFGHATALGTSLASVAEALSPSTGGRGAVVISSEANAPLFRPPLVGRDAELESVLDCVHRATRSSRGAMLLVSGESGIGKTFFTAEVAQRALLAGIQVITSECLPSTLTQDVTADAGTIPLQGFRRFFETLRDRCHERGRGEIDRLFGSRLPLLTAYLPMLVHLRPAGDAGEAPPALPAAAARERIVASVVDTIAAYAGSRPLLLAIDDLQWADDLTLAVLERLDDDLFGQLPLIVVGTYRTDEAPEGIRRISEKSGTHRLHLGRLARKDIGAIVGGMLSMAAPPEPLVEYVDAHAEGVPFFAAEYLRTLVAAGGLVYRGGAWSASSAELGTLGARGEGRLPRTLHDLIRARLDRLSPESLQLLEAGAVLGREFSLSLVARMVNRPEGDLVATMAATVAAQITKSDGFDRYTFLHDKIRETLYAGLSSERRTELHLNAARAMEEAPAVSPDLYGQIGHHLRLGGELPRAMDYFEKAGMHALEIGANVESDRFFRELIDLEAGLESRQPLLRRARWLRQRGDALGGLGKMAESATSLRESAALLGRPFPTGTLEFARMLSREIAIQIAHRVFPDGVRRLTAEAGEADAETMRVFERMHEVSYYLGRDADLVLSTTVSLNAAERGGPTPSLAIAYTNAAMMAGVLPLPVLAKRYFRLAAAVVQAAADLSAESWLLEMEGHYWICQGDRDRGVRCLDRALALARQGGFARRSNEAQSIRICLDLYGGRHAPALASVGEVEQSARRRRDEQIQCWVHLEKAEARLLRGEDDLTRAEIAAARSPQFSAVFGRPEQIWATGLEAHALCRAGERDRARRLVEHGIKLVLRGPPAHSYCLGACSRLAESALALCRQSRGAAEYETDLRIAQRACRMLKRAARVFPIAGPAAVLHEGSLDLLTGRRPPASVAPAWRDAALAAARMDLPYQELSLLRAIRRLGGLSAPARAAIQRRIGTLAEALELDPETLLPPGPRAGLEGSIQVEREPERPRLS